jgi:hypothetical protein
MKMCRYVFPLYETSNQQQQHAKELTVNSNTHRERDNLNFGKYSFFSLNKAQTLTLKRLNALFRTWQMTIVCVYG